LSRTTESIDRAVKMRLSMLSKGSLWQSKKSMIYRQYDKLGSGRENRCLIRPGDIVMIVDVEFRDDMPEWQAPKPWFNVTFLCNERVFKAEKVYLHTFTENYTHLLDSNCAE